MASITDRIATVRVCLRFFIWRRDHVSEATASAKLPIARQTHRNKGDSFQRHARDFSTSVEMTRLHRNYKQMRQLAVNVSGMGQLTQLDTDDCYDVTTEQSASRLPESVGDRGDLRSPGRA